MEACGNNQFIVKSGINYSAIQRETYPRQSEFKLDEKDLKSIVKFLQENAPDNSRTQIVATKSDKNLVKIEKNNIIYNIPEQMKSKTESLRHLAAQNGRTYIKFVFNDVRKIEICYIFDPVKECLLPCYIQYQMKKYFANNAYMKEFGLSPEAKSTNTQKAGVPKASTTVPAKSNVTKTPSTKAPTKATTKEADKKEKSWWDKLTGGEDNAEKKEVKKEPAKKDIKKEADKEKSWWKVW